MKHNEYLIVHKSILPDYYPVIIKARELINDKNVSVSDACKQLNISRSTYYKYKDYIFTPAKDSGNKAIFNIKTVDTKGILSAILKIVTESSGNVISINQDSPIDGSAYITMSIDICDLTVTIDELIEKIKLLEGIKSVDIMGVE